MLRYKKLGFSFVRLLPKETGVRPIVNLRRKIKKVKNSVNTLFFTGTHLLIKFKLHEFVPLSINQILQTTFQILTYEKVTIFFRLPGIVWDIHDQANRPELIGAAVFGRNEIYARLKQFKLRLLDKRQHMYIPPQHPTPRIKLLT